MLPKSQRLNLRLKFKWVVTGNSLPSKSFKLFYKLGENLEPQVGVSIVSSQFKKATLRNQAKRICFKLAQDNYHLLPNGLNLVIMPNAQVLDLPSKTLGEEFQNAVSRLKIN